MAVICTGTETGRRQGNRFSSSFYLGMTNVPVLQFKRLEDIFKKEEKIVFLIAKPKNEVVNDLKMV